MIWIYNLLLTFLAPIWVPWMLWRARRRDEKPIWKERAGDWDLKPVWDSRRVWIHAVSVGEVMAVIPVLRSVKHLEPEVEIVLTTTTSSGRSAAIERAAGLYDHLFYFPIDVARFQLAALSRARPRVVAIVETELWMNLLYLAKQMRVPTMLVNGRISDRAFPRMKRVRCFYRSMLGLLGEALMRTETDAQRARELGAKNVRVLGNSKFDESVPDVAAEARRVREEFRLDPSRPCVVVGSTRSPGEEAFVAEALRDPRLERVQVVWAPRHIERAEEVARLCQELGVGLRSKNEKARVLVLDTYGELASAYCAADVAVIGGGFEDFGGQSLIQPLLVGKPVVHGPHMSNFRDVAEAAAHAGASRVVATPGELADALVEIIGDPALAARMSSAALELAASSRGASLRYAQAIVDAYRASRLS